MSVSDQECITDVSSVKSTSSIGDRKSTRIFVKGLPKDGMNATCSEHKAQQLTHHRPRSYQMLSRIMVRNAFKSLSSRKSLSLAAVRSFISENYNLKNEALKLRMRYIKRYISKSLDSGQLIQVTETTTLILKDMSNSNTKKWQHREVDSIQGELCKIKKKVRMPVSSEALRYSSQIIKWKASLNKSKQTHFKETFFTQLKQLQILTQSLTLDFCFFCI
uniref:H15 domain-containing protein n=1 Tax=Glossina austeni TaxID=7395 RepID=A0A1A9VYH6_GLOAU